MIFGLVYSRTLSSSVRQFGVRKFVGLILKYRFGKRGLIKFTKGDLNACI